MLIFHRHFAYSFHLPVKYEKKASIKKRILSTCQNVAWRIQHRLNKTPKRLIRVWTLWQRRHYIFEKSQLGLLWQWMETEQNKEERRMLRAVKLLSSPTSFQLSCAEHKCQIHSLILGMNPALVFSVRLQKPWNTLTWKWIGGKIENNSVDFRPNFEFQ